jgi:hypothetical protein
LSEEYYEGVSYLLLFPPGNLEAAVGAAIWKWTSANLVERKKCSTDMPKFVLFINEQWNY